MFETITEEDFTTIVGKRPEHLEIEKYLKELCRKGLCRNNKDRWEEVDFVNKVLAHFGWKHGDNYGKDPKQAAAVFNKIATEISKFENSTKKKFAFASNKRKFKKQIGLGL